MRFDPSQNGLNTLFRPYQSVLLEHIWDLNNEIRRGITASQAKDFLQRTGDMELKRSRATVIFFLNDLVDDGILEYERATGKGGFRRVYFPTMDRGQFASQVVETMINKLAEVFPCAYREAVRKR